jgi:hypothetical protein
LPAAKAKENKTKLLIKTKATHLLPAAKAKEKTKATHNKT